MRTWYALALALAFGGPVAAQQPAPRVATGMATGKRIMTAGWDASLRTPQRRAVHIVQPLCNGSSKDPAYAIRMLGTALLDVENQLSSLERNASGNQKTELASFRGHESQARVHYTELLKVTKDPQAARQHALAIRQELTAAGNALTTVPDDWTARSKPVR